MSDQPVADGPLPGGATGRARERAARAVAAAVAVAADYELTVDRPVVIRALSTVLVRLDPHPVVARVLLPGFGVPRTGSLSRGLREALLLDHLARVGAPAVPVSPLIPPGPHVHEGVPVVVAARVPHNPLLKLDGTRLARSLADLHAGLLSFAGTLPTVPHLAETLGWLSLPEVADPLGPEVRDRLAEGVQAAEVAMSGRHPVLRPLHGDAHSGNALLAPDGAVCWGDLEDACMGPLEWDLACLVTTARVFGGDTGMARDALAAWGIVAHPDLLERLVIARAAQVVAWGWLAAAHDARRQRSAQLRTSQLLEHLAARSP